MCGIPCVNNVGIGLAGAGGDECVVNRSAYDSHRSDTFDGGKIFITVKPHQRKSLLNFSHKQGRGFSAEALLSGASGEGRVHLGETVSGTAGIFAARSGKGGEAASMVYMIRQECRYQDGAVEEPSHRRFFFRGGCAG